MNHPRVGLPRKLGVLRPTPPLRAPPLRAPPGPFGAPGLLYHIRASWTVLMAYLGRPGAPVARNGLKDLGRPLGGRGGVFREGPNGGGHPRHLWARMAPPLFGGF